MKTANAIGLIIVGVTLGYAVGSIIHNGQTPVKNVSRKQIKPRKATKKTSKRKGESKKIPSVNTNV